MPAWLSFKSIIVVQWTKESTHHQVQPSVTLDQEGVQKKGTLGLRRSRRAKKDNISKKIDEITKCMSQLLSVEETSSKGHQFSETDIQDSLRY